MTSPILILGGKPIPLDLQTVWVDAAGNPQTVGEGPIKFDFVFRGVRFAGFCDREANTLKLAGDLGLMPFTAESPEARMNLAVIIAEANDVLGPHFRLSKGHLLLGLEAEFKPPLDAVALIATVARALLPAAPYLDLVRMMIRPPLETPSGQSSLRPEWRRSKA